METLLGTSIGVFVGVTLCLMGFVAYMTGMSVANTWKPVWHVFIYGFLLGFADRFLTFSLFEGELLSFTGYLIDTAILIAIGLLAYRLHQVSNMISQYPWLYVRAGLFNWRTPNDK
ncbi:DUF6867 family protein [Pseudomonadota bacterium]